MQLLKIFGELAITSCGNSNTQTAERCQTECDVPLSHVRPAGKYLQIPHVGLQVGIASRVDHYIFLVHLRQKWQQSHVHLAELNLRHARHKHGDLPDQSKMEHCTVMPNVESVHGKLCTGNIAFYPVNNIRMFPQTLPCNSKRS